MLHFLTRLLGANQASARHPIVTYGVALVAVGAAVLVRWLLDPALGPHWATVTLYGAVMAAVWYGGYRPALVATVFGYFVCNYLFMEPRGSIAFKHTHSYVGFALYLFSCSLMIGFGAALHASQRRFAEQQDALRLSEEQLRRALRAGRLGCFAWA